MRAPTQAFGAMQGQLRRYLLRSGVRGKLALEQGWVTQHELEQMVDALMAWGDAPDAFYARPGFTALGWA